MRVTIAIVVAASVMGGCSWVAGPEIAANLERAHGETWYLGRGSRS